MPRLTRVSFLIYNAVINAHLRLKNWPGFLDTITKTLFHGVNCCRQTYCSYLLLFCTCSLGQKNCPLFFLHADWQVSKVLLLLQNRQTRPPQVFTARLTRFVAISCTVSCAPAKLGRCCPAIRPKTAPTRLHTHTCVTRMQQAAPQLDLDCFVFLEKIPQNENFVADRFCDSTFWFRLFFLPDESAVVVIGHDHGKLFHKYLQYFFHRPSLQHKQSDAGGQCDQTFWTKSRPVVSKNRPKLRPNKWKIIAKEIGCNRMLLFF
jgi:hypothetical protein